MNSCNRIVSTPEGILRAATGCLILALLTAFLFQGSIFAQAGESAAAMGRKAAVETLISSVTADGSADVRALAAPDNYVRFIGAPPASQFAISPSITGTTPEKARSFLLENRGIFMDDSANADFKITRVTNRDSATYVRMQQVYSGIPVFCGESVVQMNGDNGVSCVYTDIKRAMADLDSGGVSLAPTLTETQARERAVAMAQPKAPDSSSTGVGKDPLNDGAVDRLWPHDKYASLNFEAEPATLMILAPEVVGVNGPTRLVWKTAVNAADNPLASEVVLVDARTGHLALHYPQVCSALNRQIYDAHSTNSDGTLIRSEGQGPVGTPVDADDAYLYFGDTYNFYNTNHNRDSIDNAGMPIKGTVRLCPDSSNCPYGNAYWDDAKQRMYFGEGYASAMDVVGHELTHGVTAHESNLIYFNESGAMNESLSDMWGEWIRQTYDSTVTPADKWLLGVKLPIGAIRNMADPTTFSDPDRMGSPLYSGSIGDVGGVHTNSGIGNKLCYLLTDGATFNGRTVTGMGVVNAAKLFYECQTHLLTSASDYSDLFAVLLQAAVNLSYTQAQINNVAEACLAVELGAQAVKEAVGIPQNFWNFPMRTSSEDSRTQTIYLASEIGRSGQIAGLALYANPVPGQTMNAFTVRIKTTSESAFSSGGFEQGWTVCWQGNLTISSAGQGWLTFSTPFLYDGTSNLMVDFCFNNSSHSTDGNCLYFDSGSSRSVTATANSDPSHPDPLTWTGKPFFNTATNTRVPCIALQFAAPSATVTNVTSLTANGPYTFGNTIDIDVAFSGAVDVTGTPRLELETGTTNRYATYLGGTGTSTLRFRYTVAAGDTSADLDYTNGAALQPNGGSIKDTSTETEAILALPAPGAAGSLGANKDFVISTPPVLSVTPGSQNVSSASGSTSFSIVTTGAWTAGSDQAWATITNTSGTDNATLNINYTANTGAARLATITVTGTGTAPDSVQVTVSQAAAAAPTLSVTPANQNVSNAAGTTSFSIATTAAWSASSDQTWAALPSVSGTGDTTLNVNCEANTGETRSATIAVTGTGTTPGAVQVTVHQAGQATTVNPTPQTVVVPDVVGQTKEAALSAITAAGLVVGTIAEVYSPTITSGGVVSQDPAADAQAPAGTTVNLNISKGPEPKGCAGCKKSELTFDGLKKQLSDIFMMGLSVSTLLLLSRMKR